MGRDLITRVSKTCGHRQADSGRIKLPSETVKTQILTFSDPKTLSKRAHNPLLKEAGLTKPTAAHPSGGPVAGGRLVRLACP